MGWDLWQAKCEAAKEIPSGNRVSSCGAASAGSAGSAGSRLLRYAVGFAFALLVLFLSASPSPAQITGQGYVIVSALPAKCYVGQTAFLTIATAGQNWYGCTSQNTWTLESGGGGGGGGGSAVAPVTYGVTITGGSAGVCIPNLSGGCSGFTGTIEQPSGQGIYATADVLNPSGVFGSLQISRGTANGYSAGDIVITSSVNFTGTIQVGSGGGTALPSGGAVTYVSGPPASTTLRDFVSIKDPPYNGLGNATVLTDGAMTSGSAVLSTAHVFMSADAGDVIVVGQAGAPMLSAPAAPGVSTTGTAGSTTYSYVQVCYLSDGTHTPASAAGTVTTGNATLGSPNGNIIALSGNCDHWSIWKTAGNGAQGFIANLIKTSSYTDFSGVGDGTTAPSTNTIIGTNLLTTIQSVSSGVATLAANASSTVTAQTVDFSPSVASDTSAFQLAGTSLGKNGRIVIPPGVYLLSNTAALAMADDNFVNQEWDFLPGAQIIFTDKSSGASSGFEWYGTNPSASLGKGLIVNGLNLTFAGDPRIIKGIYVGPNPLVVQGTTNATFRNLVIQGSPGVGMSAYNNINLQLANTTINNTASNAAYLPNNQNLLVNGFASVGSGDACVEADYLNVAPYTSGLYGGLVTGVNCSNSFGGILSAGDQNLVVSNFQIIDTCEAGLNLQYDASVPSFVPANVRFSNGTIYGAGAYSSPYFGGNCAPGSGNGIVYFGGITSVYFSNISIVGSTNNPIQGEETAGSYTSAFASFDDIRLSGNTGDAIWEYTTNLEIGKFSFDTQTGSMKLFNNGTIKGYGGWHANNVCTAGTACSNRAIDLEANVNVFLPAIDIVDSQATSTGYKFLESGTTGVDRCAAPVAFAISNATPAYSGTCIGSLVPDATAANMILKALGIIYFAPNGTNQWEITTGGTLQPVATNTNNLCSFSLTCSGVYTQAVHLNNSWTLGTVTVGHLATFVGSSEVGNCTAIPCTTPIGIFGSSSGDVIPAGSIAPSVTLDGNQNTAFNDYICQSSTTAGESHDSGTTPCTTGQFVGIAQKTQSSVTSATVLLRLQ